jgi:PAS domain S-box-containing protein
MSNLDPVNHASKPIESATNQNEAIMALFYNLPFIGMAITSPYSQYWLRFNDRLCEILGYSRAALTDITWTEITHPDDLDLDMAEFGKVMRGESEGYVIDKRFIRQDGKIVYTTIDVKSVRKSDLTVDFFVATVQDISDRKLAEMNQKQIKNALIESENRYREVVQTQVDFVLQSSPDTTITFANDSLCRALGLPLSRVIGLRWIDFQGDVNLINNILLKISQLSPINPTFLEENSDLRADGQIGWTQWVNQGLFDQDGKLIAIQSAGRDITALKNAENALQKLNQDLEIRIKERTAALTTNATHLKTAQRIGKVGSWEFDLQTGEVIWSEEVFRIFGRDPKIPTPTYSELQKIIHPDDWEYFDQVVKNAILMAQSYNVDYRILWADATLIYVAAKGEMICDSMGKPIQIIGTIMDISDRKLAEAKIVETAHQLECTNRELESFSYSVSHDLRAPLRHMNGFINALQQQLQNYEVIKDPKVKHYIEIIENSSQKMGDLIDGLLTLSRYGRKSLELKQVSICELVNEAIEIVCGDPSHQRSVQFEIGDLPIVKGDPILLKLVFQNLISNAIKFSRNQPHPSIKIDSLPDGTIRVIDNGVGFKMEYADKLFGAFQRLHHQKDFEGTGIGLAIVQRIVQRHNGSVWAESQPNQGTTFFVKI